MRTTYRDIHPEAWENGFEAALAGRPFPDPAEDEHAAWQHAVGWSGIPRWGQRFGTSAEHWAMAANARDSGYQEGRRLLKSPAFRAGYAAGLTGRSAVLEEEPWFDDPDWDEGNWRARAGGKIACAPESGKNRICTLLGLTSNL